MSNGGFLGGPAAVEQPKTVEVPQAAAEVDAYAAAEQEARQEMATEQQKDTFLEKAGEAAPTTVVASAAGAQAAIPAQPVEVVKDAVTLEVEKILEEGLGDYVPDMPDEARQRFLNKGGEVAGELSTMVRSLNVTVKRVVELIRDWLLTIPGVNRYFIEQEAKIKTDKIVDLADAHRAQPGGEQTT